MARDTILVVDDEPAIVQVIGQRLTGEGFQIRAASDGKAGLAALADASRQPDLLILDLMLPDMDGLDLLRSLRQAGSSMPVIILTARDDDVDVIVGLELGADDYVVKPFNPRELAARVRAVLRRLEKVAVEQDILRQADIMLDRAGRLVKVTGQPVDLTPSEFELLATLMATPGRAFSRLELLDRLQGTAFEGYERTIDVHIRNLRAKIEPDAANPQYVETVYGVGYRFAPQRQE